MSTSIAAEILNDWRENHFEQWFKDAKPHLPDIGPVLLVSLPRPFRNMVDMICLDADGDIVIIEVKNESSTRETVGQALEYLAKYSEVQVEDLAEEFENLNNGSSLLVEYEKSFGKPLARLSNRRRIYLAAPKFNTHSVIAAQYFSKLLEPNSISMHLLQIECRGRDPWLFDIALYPVTWTQAKDLSGVVMNSAGKVYRVLVPGARPIVWLVGSLDTEDRLMPPTGAQRKRLIKIRPKPGRRIDHMAALVDESQAGTIWQKEKHGPNKRSRLLGIVEYRDGTQAVLGQFVGSDLDRFRLVPLDQFQRDWRPANGVPDPPDWSVVATKGR